MTAAMIPPAIVSRIGALVRLLGSPIDGEALAACRALGRTLQSAGVDIHTLADTIEHPSGPVVILHDPPTASRTKRKPQSGDIDLDHAQRWSVAEALRRGLAGDRLSEWEQAFASSIAERLGTGRGLLSERQGETLRRLLRKIGEAVPWA